jgi:micrococcal nuclease
MITLVAACLLVACACGTAPLPDGVAIVEEVVDGDTLVVRVGSGTERVRLLGIDTPETVHPTKPVECFGPEASRELKRLAPAGSQLRLGRDTELRDRYGRLLAHAWNAEGTFINEALVEGGFARNYAQHRTGPSPHGPGSGQRASEPDRTVASAP